MLKSIEGRSKINPDVKVLAYEPIKIIYDKNILFHRENNIKDCKIEFNTGATITIRSTDSEFVLMNILKILNQNNIVIDDLSAMPTNLEDIFLKVVSDSNASDN